MNANARAGEQRTDLSVGDGRDVDVVVTHFEDPQRLRWVLDSLAAQGIAYVPYFPLGGFSPLQSDALNARLILILANHIGDPQVLRQALAAAALKPEQTP